jgi:hypothetical protein
MTVRPCQLTRGWLDGLQACRPLLRSASKKQLPYEDVSFQLNLQRLDWDVSYMHYGIDIISREEPIRQTPPWVRIDQQGVEPNSDRHVGCTNDKHGTSSQYKVPLRLPALVRCLANKEERTDCEESGGYEDSVE